MVQRQNSHRVFEILFKNIKIIFKILSMVDKQALKAVEIIMTRSIINILVQLYNKYISTAP